LLVKKKGTEFINGGMLGPDHILSYKLGLLLKKKGTEFINGGMLGPDHILSY
jgi:hypothetical protein